MNTDLFLSYKDKSIIKDPFYKQVEYDKYSIFAYDINNNIIFLGYANEKTLEELKEYDFF